MSKAEKHYPPLQPYLQGLQPVDQNYPLTDPSQLHSKAQKENGPDLYTAAAGTTMYSGPLGSRSTIKLGQLNEDSLVRVLDVVVLDGIRSNYVRREFDLQKVKFWIAQNPNPTENSGYRK